MKTLNGKSYASTKQAVPGGYKTGQAQPLMGNATVTDFPNLSARQAQVAADHVGTQPVKRQHTDAATAKRLPVAAPRCQDADPAANHGVTIVVENGTPVCPPGSTLR